jgi:hypothetical protein
VEVDRFEAGDRPQRALDRDSDDEPHTERVAESCTYHARVDREYEEACDARAQALPELREISAARTEVFDRMEATQAPRDVGSVLPKSFNLSTASGDIVWVAPNATKHVWEETRGLTFGRGISQEQRLIGLAGAIDSATIGNWENIQVSKGWELIFSEPRGAGVNPVLKHARYTGGGDL